MKNRRASSPPPCGRPDRRRRPSSPCPRAARAPSAVSCRSRRRASFPRRRSERPRAGDAAVLVRVGDVLRQRVHEELREVRFISLERALRRRDDHSIGPRQHRQHVAARAREIDERHLLRRKPTEQGCAKSRALEVGTGNADLRLLALSASMPDQHEHHLIPRLRPRGELAEHAFDIRLASTGLCSAAVSRRCPRQATRSPSPAARTRFDAASASAAEIFVNDSVYFLSPPRPLTITRCVCAQVEPALSTTRPAAASAARQPTDTRRPPRPPRPHANPRIFRYDHSAVTRPTSSSSTAGMSQRSIWFTTVTPCLLSATSSARVFAVAGV